VAGISGGWLPAASSYWARTESAARVGLSHCARRRQDLASHLVSRASLELRDDTVHSAEAAEERRLALAHVRAQHGQDRINGLLVGQTRSPRSSITSASTRRHMAAEQPGKSLMAPRRLRTPAFEMSVTPVTVHWMPVFSCVLRAADLAVMMTMLQEAGTQGHGKVMN
jgi:hypothetical protein